MMIGSDAGFRFRDESCFGWADDEDERAYIVLRIACKMLTCNAHERSISARNGQH